MKRKNLLILIFLFILSLVGISFFGGPVTWLFFALVILVPLFCLIYIVLVIFSLKIYQRSDGRDMVCGRPSDFYITLNNEGPFSFSSVRIIFYSSFSTVMGLDDTAVYELPPRSSLTRTTKLVCRYRGQYEVGIKEIEITDIIGLFCIRYRIKEPLSVIVAPALKHLSELREGDDFPSVGRDSLTSRTEPDIPVREYVPGDDIRLLNHRASAAMQKLMLRERTGVEKNGIAIVMDSTRRRDIPEQFLPAENSVIESTLALALYYMENHIPVTVSFFAGDTISLPVTSPGEFEALYTRMKGFSFADKDATLTLLDELSVSGAAAGYEMLIFIFYDAGADELSLTDRIRSFGTPVRIIDFFRLGTDTPTEDVL